MRILAALAVLALAQDPPKPPPAAPAKAPEYVALTGGDVYTVTRGVLKNATVLVKDGKIHRVGHDVDLPEGTTKHDCSGRRVLPGFVVANARGLGMSGMSSSAKIADALDPYQETLKLALASGITSAYIEYGFAGGLFGGRAEGGGGTSAVVKMSYGDLDRMLLVEPASVPLSSWITGTALQRQQLREQLQKARETLDKIRDFERRKAEGKTQSGEQPPAADPMVRLLRGDAIARISASNADQIQTALKLVNEFRFRCILVDVDEGWTMADEIGRARAYCIITPRSKKYRDRNVNRPNGSTIEQAALLGKAGVKFAVTSLSPGISTGGIAGRDLMNLPLEAAFGIRGGLDEQTALESITITAAEMCGVENRIGSIEEGKDADLIVLDGDPFDYRTFVELTFIEGKLLYEKDKSPYFNHLKRKP